jgi:hypothetical protein
MVLFVDLEDENAEPPERVTPHWQQFHQRGLRTARIGTLDGNDEARPNPNKNAITEALGCYPYVYHDLTSAIMPLFVLHEAYSMLSAELSRR